MKLESYRLYSPRLSVVAAYAFVTNFDFARRGDHDRRYLVAAGKSFDFHPLLRLFRNVDFSVGYIVLDEVFLEQIAITTSWVGVDDR